MNIKIEIRYGWLDYSFRNDENKKGYYYIILADIVSTSMPMIELRPDDVFPTIPAALQAAAERISRDFGLPTGLDAE